MRTRSSTVTGLALAAVAGLTFISIPSPVYGQGRGGGRGGDPNVNPSRTVDNVKYVDGENAAPNSQPNPYTEVSWPQLPDGRELGGISAIITGPNGNIWVADRCGPGNCTDSELNPIWEFDPDGNVIQNFGAGLFVYPHGIWVDNDGFVWVTDARNADGKGEQVIKFSPDGEEVMRLGTAGVRGLGNDTFNGACDVITAPNGDIFVADGHENDVSRIMKFDSEGNYLMEWGRKGTGPGEFGTPHALAMDSQGRLFVADRENNRIQIFTQDGTLLEVWYQFGRNSGVYIDANDILYAADSESNTPRNPGFRRGIRIGSVTDGMVDSFIPYTDQERLNAGGTAGYEGVTADADGNVYAGFVLERDLTKFVRDGQ